MKRTMNLVAVLLCVLCALCMVGCKNNATDDTGSSTVTGTWGAIETGTWSGPGNDDFATSSKGTACRITYNISSNPGTLAVVVDTWDSGASKWDTTNSETATIKSSLTDVSSIKMSCKYENGNVLVYNKEVLYSTEPATADRKSRFQLTINNDSKYFYTK